MAKANDKSSTIDWIWLHDALMLAIPRFGSVVLAKERLTEGLAAGKLPWSYMSWWGLDAERRRSPKGHQRSLRDCLRSRKTNSPCLNCAHNIVEPVEPFAKSFRGFACVVVTLYSGHCDPGST